MLAIFFFLVHVISFDLRYVNRNELNPIEFKLELN